MSELELYGRDLFGEVIKPESRGAIADKFTFPPFTVLDAKSGAWQDRKRAWASLGIKGEEGRVCRGNNSFNNLSLTPRKIDYAHKFSNVGDGPTIFDPTLTELAYRWWCPKGGQIVDPFAGGSVRGIVASMLSRKYWGCDLRQEQIDANEAQADAILESNRPVWICGDSMQTLDNAPDADFVFSCPPYGDLEKYSDDPQDLSSMEWHTFVAAYKRIILRSIKRLKENRFACFVVGDFRDKKGFYRNFVSETIDGFEACGARLYNEAILTTSIGSASMRVNKQFDAGRKLAKVHQNVLVFCKGDWKKATEACGKI
jgi:DNA modification methylase